MLYHYKEDTLINKFNAILSHFNLILTLKINLIKNIFGVRWSVRMFVCSYVPMNVNKIPPEKRNEFT